MKKFIFSLVFMGCFFASQAGNSLVESVPVFMAMEEVQVDCIDVALQVVECSPWDVSSDEGYHLYEYTYQNCEKNNP